MTTDSANSSFAKLPKLGVGIGYRDALKADIFLNSDAIDFVEITTDHFIDAPAGRRRELEALRERFTVIPHSLELSLGSAEGIDQEYLEKVAEIVEFVDAPWFSDHLCFTKSGGVKIGHLAPVPFTEEALAVFVSNISQVTKVISAPLVLENITYLVRFPSSTMTEAEFIRRLVNETECGLLLDVTNLYVNSVNFGFDWRRFLDEIPLERVVQVHFVGSRREGRRLIDAHSDSTEEAIWEVFAEVSQRCNLRGAILERDDDFPPFSELAFEVQRARSIMSAPELKMSSHAD